MDKILNYIKNGRGLGLKILLIFTLIISVYVAGLIKTGGTDMIPLAQQVADQLLPLKVENGVIVDPVDTVRTASLADGMIRLPLVIDTSIDTLDTSRLEQGVYLTRTTLYTINKNEVRIKKLEGSFYLPQQDYTDFFNYVLNWVAVLSFFLVLIFGFLIYFLICVFYALCASIIARLSKKQYNFETRMRLTMISFITAEIIAIPLNWLNVNSTLLFFVIVIALQTFLLRSLSTFEAEAIPETEEKEVNE